MKNIISAKYQEDLHNDVELFRVFGPAHSLTGQILGYGDEEPPCGRYGGSCMHLCIEFENFDENGDVYDPIISETRNYDAIDWYSGCCDFCDRRIRERQHAVRRPQPAGGWLGCYCSWNHVRKDVARPDPLIMIMIDRFEAQFNKYKTGCTKKDGLRMDYIRRV